MAISKRKLIYPIFATLVLLGLVVIAVCYVQLKDIDALRLRVIEEIHAETQRDVQIGSAQLDFTEGLGVLLGDVTLKGSSSQQSDFTCKQVLVLLDWLPLLEGSVKIRKLIFEGLMVQVTRDDKGDFNFGDLSAVEASRSGATLPDLIRAGLMHSVSVRKSELWVVDHLISSGKKPLITKINNLSLSLNKHFSKSSLRVHLDGDMPFSRKKSGRVKLTGKIRMPEDWSNLTKVAVEGALEIKEVGTERFQPYLAKVFEQHPGEHMVSLSTQFAGTLDGHFQLSGSLKHTQQVSSTFQPSLPKESPPVQGTLDYNFIFNQDTVEFKQLDYRSGDFLLMISGTYAHFLSDKAWLTVTLKSAPFPSQKSADYLPLKVFSKELHERSHRFIKKGNVEIASLNIEGPRTIFEGRPNEQIEAYDSGSLILHQVDLGADALSLKGVTGGIHFKNGVVSVQVQGAQYEHVAIKNLVGTVTHPFTDPWVAGTLEAEGALAPLALLIEREWTLPHRLTFLKELKRIKGTGRGKLLVQGPLRKMEKLKWSGNVSLERAEFAKQGWSVPIHNINGSVYFRSIPGSIGSSGKERPEKIWTLEFKNFKGELGNHYFTDIEAEAFVKKGVPVKNVRGKIQLGVLKAEQVISTPLDARVRSFLKHVLLESGEIDFKFQNTGPGPGEKHSRNQGSLKIKKLFLKHSKGFRALKNLTATVSFDDRTINLKTAKGWYGDSPLNLKGQLKNYSDPDPELILTAHSTGFLRQDFSGIPFLETLEYQGPAIVSLKFHGTDRLMKLEKAVDLTRASYRYKNFLIKPENVSNSIKISATLDSKGKVDFKKVAFELEGSQVAGKGYLKSMDDPQFSIQLDSDHFKTWPASQYIRPLQGSMGGNAHFHISAQGNFNQLEEAVIQGSVILKGIEYKPDSLLVPIKFNADMKFKNNFFQIQNGKLEAKGSKVFFKGDYQGGEAPQVKLKLVGPGLDLNQMVSEEGKPSKGFLGWLGGTRVFSKGTGEVDIKLGRFTHQFWTLPEIAGKFTFKDQVLQTRNLTLGQPKIDQVMIRGKLSLADVKDPSFDTALISRRVPINKLFAMFGDMFHASLTGQTVWLKAHLKGRGDNLKKVTQSLQGRVSFDLKNGRINTGRLLNGTIQLFGITADPVKTAERSRQPNTGYLQIFGDFSLTNGVARTENFLYEEKGQRMSLVGAFDLNASRMGTVVGVAPFRRVGRIIKKIPILGPIVTGGEEGSLITTYYKVEGPFSDPRIESVPLQSVSKKVLGTFQGIFTAPSELFSSQEPSTE